MKIFCCEGEEVEKRLHIGELYDLYYSLNSIREMKLRRLRWAGHMVQLEERRCTHRVLVRKLERERQRLLESLRRRLKGNIKSDLQ